MEQSSAGLHQYFVVAVIDSCFQLNHGIGFFCGEIKPNRGVRYEGWHHFWDYSGGDAGNDGVHLLDLARWLVGVEVPKSVRERPSADIEHGHRSALLVHYANTSYRLGGELLKINEQEQFVGNPAAMKYFRCEYRKPWVIEEAV